MSQLLYEIMGLLLDNPSQSLPQAGKSAAIFSGSDKEIKVVIEWLLETPNTPDWEETLETFHYLRLQLRRRRLLDTHPSVLTVSKGVYKLYRCSFIIERFIEVEIGSGLALKLDGFIYPLRTFHSRSLFHAVV